MKPNLRSNIECREQRNRDARAKVNYSNRVTRWGILRVVASLALVSMACELSDITNDLNFVVQVNRSTQVSTFLLDQMSSNDILLFADVAHGQWQPRETVIDFLEAWFQTATHESLRHQPVPNLAFVLEIDSLYLFNVLRYMDSGNPEDIIDIPLMGPGIFSTADLEFYWRLGDLRRRIVEYNSSHKQGEPVNLALIAGESSMEVENWSFDQGTQYHLHSRDQEIAQRIVSLSTAHQNFKIVAFYGSAHLQRGLATKHARGQTAEGLYLVSYLDSLIEGNVVTIGQVTPPYWGKYEALFSFEGGDYIIELNHSDRDLRRILKGPIGYDVAIVHDRTYLSSVPLLAIPSMNIARLAIEGMPGITNTSNDFYRAYWPSLIRYLNGISGNSPHRIDIMDSTALKQEFLEWNEWLSGAPESIVSSVESLRLWQKLIDSLNNANGSKAAEIETIVSTFLPNAPLLWREEGWPSPSERASELRTYLIAEQDNIVRDNLISLLWVGNSQERREAQDALQRITDTTFATVAQWAEWHRQAKPPDNTDQ